MLRGETDTKKLEDVGVNFWKGNTSREALDKVGLGHLNEGELGSAYSWQWRDSGGYSGGYGEDQLDNLIEGLRTNKYSRRHLVTLWNPKENKWGCITPCHHTSQYVVLPNKDGGDTLHVKLVNRSLDCVFGLRYAIMQYRMFQMVLCKMFGFKLGRLSLDLSQYHIYHNQIEYVKEHLQREEVDKELSCISIKDGVVLETLEHLLNMKWSDWDVKYEYNKQPYKTERPKMVA